MNKMGKEGRIVSREHKNIKHTLDIDVEVSRCFGRDTVVRLTDVCPSRVWSDANREKSARDSQIYKTRKKQGVTERVHTIQTK